MSKGKMPPQLLEYFKKKQGKTENKKDDKSDDKVKKEDKKKGGDAIQGASPGEVTRVWVGAGAKVAPQQVAN